MSSVAGHRFLPTPRPDEGAVSWNINTACNYRCSYCTQRFKEDRGRWSRDTPKFIEAFSRLPGRWEIKISGGEPFVHPTLVEIVAGLAGAGHRVSIVTNFSASMPKIEQFVAAARGRVGVFSCSLHLQYVNTDRAFEQFVEKARATAALLIDAHDPSLPKPSLCVTSVATRSALPRLEAIRERFVREGITHKVQPEKQDRELVHYDERDAQKLVSLGGHNLTGQLAHRYRGRPCWAGSRYFIVDDQGETYRCYPARRFKVERMGNLLSPGFTLAEGPSPCLYNLCVCTVPIARGMMPRDSSDARAEEETT